MKRMWNFGNCAQEEVGESSALGPSGLLDNVLHALRALRLCDPRNSALEIFLKIIFVDTQKFLPDVLTPTDLW